MAFKCVPVDQDIPQVCASAFSFLLWCDYAMDRRRRVKHGLTQHWYIMPTPPCIHPPPGWFEAQHGHSHQQLPQYPIHPRHHRSAVHSRVQFAQAEPDGRHCQPVHSQRAWSAQLGCVGVVYMDDICVVIGTLIWLFLGDVAEASVLHGGVWEHYDQEISRACTNIICLHYQGDATTFSWRCVDSVGANHDIYANGWVVWVHLSLSRWYYVSEIYIYYFRFH